MKSPAFDYIKPRSLGQVFDLLAEYGDEARLLAGGQTLLATLNMRLSEPSLLIDINQIESLKGISVVDGALRIGALARHAEIEASALVAHHAPLMSIAAPHIAHRAIRNRGTLGGSLAYADPAAEWPACALALDATIIARSTEGERRIPAAQFFLDLYTTALRPGEIIVACDIPLRVQGGIHGFDELARRHGDYAIAGLAFAARRNGAALSQVRLSFLGLCSTPWRATATERFLEDKPIDDALLEAAGLKLSEELSGEREPLADLTNSISTKRHLASVLLRRVVKAACFGTPAQQA
ncbi:MAG: binding domain in molybdopterin dehydrogenase family protein [Herminiimonas sp.]|nr:binding domain in molybdopterin dehydrogenase family protein [Herminiimonas sp.]MDB5853642.1 binding domain in molybdopterin dehydrogenase family protein [Herminiimonas sp.]